KGSQQLWIDFVEARLGSFLLWRAVIDHVLVIDFGKRDVGPTPRLFHRQPIAIGLEAKLEHPFRLVLLRRYHAHGIFTQPTRNGFRLDVRNPAVLVFAICEYFSST